MAKAEKREHPGSADDGDEHAATRTKDRGINVGKACAPPSSATQMAAIGAHVRKGDACQPGHLSKDVRFKWQRNRNADTDISASSF
jgi:hypothetical protein